jgi:hypothetical protein
MIPQDEILGLLAGEERLQDYVLPTSAVPPGLLWFCLTPPQDFILG